MNFDELSRDDRSVRSGTDSMYDFFHNARQSMQFNDADARESTMFLNNVGNPNKANVLRTTVRESMRSAHPSSASKVETTTFDG